MNLRHVKQESLAWQDMSQLRKPLGSEIWKEKREMIKTQHPWQLGPTELIDFALERMYKGSDFDRRLAFLILDVGVETLFKTYLTLPDGVTQFQIKRGDRLAASEGNFHELLRGVQNSNPKKAAGLNFPYVEYYHNLRNTLYHQGNQVTTVSIDQIEGYAKLAVDLLREYLDIDLSSKLTPPEPVKIDDTDPVADSVEVEVSFGRYRIERLKSQSIRVFSITTNTYEMPVKPFLRAVIEELSLPIEFTVKSGAEKNTQALGKDVIDELKPSAWHGWVAGQKIRRDALINVLTARIREGAANQKKWSKVDYLQILKDEYLVFQPTGKGYGNSPFNLNCWETVDGKPIKQD